MLRIQTFALETIGALAPMVRRVGAKDPDLARQLRRAASSIVLNLAEARAAHDGNSRLRFRSALGSAMETTAALELAIAWEFVEGDAKLLDALDRIAATLRKLGRWGP